MPLTRIKSSAIGTDAITSARIDDGAVATVDIADQAVTLSKLEHGTSSNNGKFLRANNGADPSYETVNTDLVADTTPQLGGALDAQTNNITNVGSVGIGTASPTRQVMLSRTIAAGSGELGIVSSDSSTSGALGNIHFGNSTDSSLASIRATADGATDAGKLEFNTEATGGAIETALRIDSGGRVFKPRQVSFIANGTNAAYINTSPIPFPNVVQNVGNGYNNSNYTFTAPVAGTYLIHCHIGLTQGASGASVYPYLAINGSNHFYTYHAINASAVASNCNMTQLLVLAANDTVKLNFYGTGNYYNNSAECRFMGCLLH